MKRLKDKKITIYSSDVTTDENGTQHEVWKPIHPGKLWAYVRHLSGEEVARDMGTFAHDSILVAINWRNDFDTHVLIEYQGKWSGQTHECGASGHWSFDAHIEVVSGKSTPIFRMNVERIF